jgi:hypothetical protein
LPLPGLSSVEGEGVAEACGLTVTGGTVLAEEDVSVGVVDWGPPVTAGEVSKGEDVSEGAVGCHPTRSAGGEVLLSSPLPC